MDTFDYKGDDPAWTILYRWYERFSTDPRIAALFLRSDGKLHSLAQAINAALAAAVEAEREAIAQWHDHEANICGQRGYDDMAEHHRAFAAVHRARSHKEAK